MGVLSIALLAAALTQDAGAAPLIPADPDEALATRLWDRKKSSTRI